MDSDQVYAAALSHGIGPARLALLLMDNPKLTLDEAIKAFKDQKPNLSPSQEEQRRKIMEGPWQPTKEEVEDMGMEAYARWRESGVGMKKEEITDAERQATLQEALASGDTKGLFGALELNAEDVQEPQEPEADEPTNLSPEEMTMEQYSKQESVKERYK